MKRYVQWAVLACCCLAPKLEAAETLQLQPEDHICIIGNTFADRMQHSGWLESLLQARFPEYKLSVRNLGFSGDELKVRLRSEGFGTPEEWLKKEGATVILAFFGYNESFRGP